ncbi:2-dehydro-3-deoxy-phosphogluconate aldolase [soil metagenome]
MVGQHENLEALLRRAGVIPVLVIEDVAAAVPLARALVGGGLAVLEITLRTAAAADCIRAIIAEVEGITVGSGTVLDADQLALSERLGCAFAVSPGSTPRLLAAAHDHAVPLLPGAATASESMALLEEGYAVQKFFPAEQSGGVPYLGALVSPLPQVKFCPTGGINAANAALYLKLANVVAVGGSWMMPKDRVAAGDWAEIEKMAASAAAFALAR